MLKLSGWRTAALGIEAHLRVRNEVEREVSAESPTATAGSRNALMKEKERELTRDFLLKGVEK